MTNLVSLNKWLINDSEKIVVARFAFEFILKKSNSKHSFSTVLHRANLKTLVWHSFESLYGIICDQNSCSLGVAQILIHCTDLNWSISDYLIHKILFEPTI